MLFAFQHKPSQTVVPNSAWKTAVVEADDFEAARSIFLDKLAANGLATQEDVNCGRYLLMMDPIKTNAARLGMLRKTAGGSLK